MHPRTDFRGSAKRVLGRIFLTALLATAALSAKASILPLGVNFDNTAGSSVSSAANIGWEFSITSPTTVTELDFWDESSDGLGESHPVAIWNATGATDLASALVSGTIPSGTSAALHPNSQFRAIGVAATVLPAGTYVIGARLPGNQIDAYKDGNASNVVFGSGITFIQKRFGGDSTFLRPDSTGTGTGIFGPNFAFSSVPEPSTIALAAVGLAGVAACSWRRRKRSH